VPHPPFDVHEGAGGPTVAVLLHPHPDMGGDRFNHVVEALFQGFPPAGITAVRFDFSSSTVAVATDEVLAVIDAVDADRVVLAGYSFGGDIAATVADPRVVGWFLVAPPLRIVEPSAMAAASDDRPKGIAVPEHDQFSPPVRTRQITGSWPNTTLAVVPGADHFLEGATADVVDQAVGWLHAASLLGE